MDAPIAMPVADAPRGASAWGSLYGRSERLALAAGALLMVVIVAGSVLLASRTATNLRNGETSRNIRLLTTDLLQLVTNAESGQRGYLLIGRREYLAPYLDATRRVPDLLARLDQVLDRSPEVKALQEGIQSKMVELARTVRLQEAGRHDEALALVETDLGRNVMEKLRGVARKLETTQRLRISTDLAASETGARGLVWVDLAALLGLLLLAVFVGSSLRRTLLALDASGRSLEAANAELRRGSDRLEGAVAARTLDLTNANEEIQRFAYIVSHDLRAPLLNIIGFTSELENATERLGAFVALNLEPAGIEVPQAVREASQEDLPEAIRFIRTSTAKMDRLITAILRLSREGRRVLVPEQLDMAQLVGGVFDTVRHQAHVVGAELVSGALPAVVSDRLAIEQVFSNLVENALKYASLERPVKVEVSGTRRGATLTYMVRDNGRGIAERDLERIFELFRRAGQQTVPGEGIGLAHVRTLLRRLGGTIECSSVPGSGSTFTVVLPAVLAPDRAAMLQRGALLE